MGEPVDTIFKCTRGDTIIYSYTITDVNGDIINLTGVTEIKFTVKKFIHDSVNLFQKTMGDIVIVNPPLGTLTIQISKDDTKNIVAANEFSDYYYDLEIGLTTGPYTPYMGTFRLYPDLSDAVIPAPTPEAYNTIASAQAYFDGRLNTEAWDDATVVDQNKGLTMARRMIDQLNFLGEKTDEDQDYQFPRDDDTSTPTDIKYGEAELCLELLDGKDPELEFENLRTVSQGYANIRSTESVNDLPEYILAGIPSMAAWRYIKPYLRNFLSVDINRVT